MKLSSGFTYSFPTKVCRFQKSLYGLRQAPRQGFAKICCKLCDHGFTHSYADYSLFTYRKDFVLMALLVYVDDIILAAVGNGSSACAAFKHYLYSCFSIKDLCPLKYFLGIQVARGPKGLFLSQCKYVLEILDECGLLGSKPSDFLTEENHKLILADGSPLSDVGRYRRLVGLA